VANKGFLTIFISILAATLFFYGTSAGAALAVNKVFNSKNDFGKQSYIGTTNVSNMKESEVKEVLSADFNSLNEKFETKLIFQDVTVDLPVEAVSFDLQQTIDLAETGVENPIKTTVSEDSLLTVLNQQFSPIYFSDEDVTAIASGIEKELEKGMMPTQVYITDFITVADYSNTEVSQSSMTISSVSNDMKTIIEALNGIEISAFSTFSLLEFLESNNLSVIQDDQLTTLASVIYSTVLKTNFAVDERYIGETLHKDVPIGYEAVVNKHLGIDLKFTNINKSHFVLNVEVVGQNLIASLNGLPLLNSYEISVSGIKEFKPRTIEQYSAMVTKGNKEIQQIGENGEEAIVTKLVFNGSEEVERKEISTDFYGPIHRIEILPLIKEEELTNNESDSTNNNSSEDSSNNENENSTTNKDSNPDQSNVDNETTVDGNPPKKDHVADDENGLQYDKGGNLIKGGGK